MGGIIVSEPRAFMERIPESKMPPHPMPVITTDAPQRSPREFGSFLGCFFFMPLLLIGSVLFIPFGLGALAHQEWKEKRFSRRMKTLGRTIRYEDLEPAAESKGGTHIFEWRYKFKGPIRWWWTPDDVSALSPHPSADRFDMAEDSAFLPFIEWCFRQYTSPTSGKALYVIATHAQEETHREKHEQCIEVPTFSQQEW